MTDDIAKTMQRPHESGEAVLRESEGQFESLLNQAPLGVYLVDSDFIIRKVNPAALPVFGGISGGPVGRDFEEVIHILWDKDYADELTRIFRHTLEIGEACVAPERIEHRLDRDIIEYYEWRVDRILLPGGKYGVVCYFSDISAQVHARHEVEKARQLARANEEQQAFLLKLSDAIRVLGDPLEVQSAALRVLGEHLAVNRVFFNEVDEEQDAYVIHRTYANGVAPLTGHFRLSDIRWTSELAGSGQIVVFDDASTDPRMSEFERASYVAMEVAAGIGVPLIKDGRWVAGLGVHQVTPRHWTPEDIDLVRETAERTWMAVERARAEAGQRDSEERFAQFAKASSGGIWIRDAKTLAMEYVSPAVGRIYGIESEVILGDIEKWAAIILPEDRDIALGHIAKAQRGESVIHEFRIQRPSDGAFRWIRDTDFPLRNAQGQVERVGGIAEDITQEKLSAEHQDILLAELQHRVRNIMAMIRSITARTADSVDSVKEYASLLSGRLLTLARVQALLTRAANAGVSLITIVNDELNAQAIHKGQIGVEGDDVLLAPKAAETMTLAVHELATNALKHGALSAHNGKVSVRWTMEEKRGVPWLIFDWAEAGAPAPAAESGPRRMGFGSELIEGRIPYELGGRSSLTIGSGGAQCHLEFPLSDSSSVLETDAPERFEVFGGAIDMRGAADLTGQCILVVEDDYYLANDAVRALRGAGADVIGPCPSENAARDAIAGKRLNGAILDINLNGEASFALAAELQAEGVPFVFVTGYDPDILPPEFKNAASLQKPVDYRRVVDTLATLIVARG